MNKTTVTLGGKTHTIPGVYAQVGIFKEKEYISSGWFIVDKDELDTIKIK